MNNEWTKLNYAVHPGEILKEYLIDSGMSQIELANKIGMNKIIINEIVNGKRPITMKTAIKLETAFSFKATFWANLQMIYDEAVERLKLKQTISIDSTTFLFKPSISSCEMQGFTTHINFDSRIVNVCAA